MFRDQLLNFKPLSIFLALTLIETGYYFFLNYLACRVVSDQVSLAFVFIVMPLVHFVLRIPVTIQGLGLQEGLFIFVLGLSGVSPTDGVLISMVLRISDICSSYLPGWLLFSLQGKATFN